MTRQTLTLLLALAAWFGLLAIPFCLRPAQQEQTGGRTLTIIGPHSPEVMNEFCAAFEKHMAAQGVAVHVERVVVGGTGPVVGRVRNDYEGVKRGEPGIIDVMWGGGISPYARLAKEEALQAYIPSPEIDAAIPEESGGVVIKPKNRMYIGTAFTGFGIVVNRKICRQENLPEPKDWEDLADPRYFQRVGNADIRKTGAIKQCYEAVLQSQGWEQGWSILTRIGGNTTQFYPGSSQTPEEVGMGNVAVGFSYDRPAATEINHRGPETIAFVMPPMTVVGPDSIAILKGAPEPELARQFIDFVLSQEGQSLWIRHPAGEGVAAVPGQPQLYTLRRMPIRPDVYKLYSADQADAMFNPFEYTARQAGGKAFLYNDLLASKRSEALGLLAGAALVDSHPALRAAWQRVMKDGCQPEALAALAAMPVTEAELTGLEGVWKKAGEGLPEEQAKVAVGLARETTFAGWKRWFVQKYERIAASGQ